MWKFKTKKRRAAEIQAERIRLSWSAPACDALLNGGQLVISEPIRIGHACDLSKPGETRTIATVRTVPVAGSQDRSGFKSTTASRWSTTDDYKRRKIIQHLDFESPLIRTGSGKLVLGYNKRALHKDIRALKYLCNNPKTIIFWINNRQSERQKKMDAAMFM